MILDQFFEQLEKQFDAKFPFVAYKKPKTLLLKGMFQRDDVQYDITNFTESGFVFAPFDSRQNAVLIPLEHSDTVSIPCDENDLSEASIKSQQTSEIIDNKSYWYWTDENSPHKKLMFRPTYANGYIWCDYEIIP